MANEKQRKTFLSYSRVNTDFAKKLAKELKAEGFPVWLDQLDIPLGARWDVELEKALEESEIFMIIMTPDSISSENVRDEIGYAIDNGKRFLPIMLENCNVPLRLRRFQYVDFSTKSFEDGVESAKQLLRGLIAQNTIPRGKIADVSQDKEVKVEVKQPEKKRIEHENETSSFAAEREKVLKASSLMKQGSQFLEDGDFSEAVKVFREILTLMPNHEKTLALLAEAEAGATQEQALPDPKAKAESDSFKTFRQDAIKASDLLVQGRKLLENKSWTEAAKVFKQVLTLNPNHLETKSLLADAEAQILEERDELVRKTRADDEIAAKAKEEAELLATKMAEADRIAKQKVEDERLAKAKVETEHKAQEETEQKEKAKEKSVEIPPVVTQPAPVSSTTTAQKKPVSKGLVIGIVAVVVLVVAGIGINALSNSRSNNPPAVENPSVDISGEWTGFIYVEGTDTYTMTLNLNQEFQGTIFVYSGEIVNEIILDSWDGHQFYFKEEGGWFFWGSLEGGTLVGKAAWECYECANSGTFELVKID